MKTIKILLVLFFLISLFSCAYRIPGINKDNIPIDTPYDIKMEIYFLYSDFPTERAKTAIRLGRMGKEAIPAIPFLLRMYGDDVQLTRSPYSFSAYSNIGSKTSPSECAFNSIVAIGEFAVDTLISSLYDIDLNVQINSAKALGFIGAQKALYPLISILNDQNILSSELKEEVLSSLVKITGVNLGYNTKAWLDWYDKKSELQR